MSARPRSDASTAPSLTGGLRFPYNRVRKRSSPEPAVSASEDHGEHGAAARTARRLDAAAVRLDDGADEAEPEPEPAFVTPRLAPVEAVPDARQVLRFDADPGILYHDPESLRVAGGLHGHTPTGRRVLHRVVHEVRERLPHPAPVQGHGARNGGIRAQ